MRELRAEDRLGKGVIMGAILSPLLSEGAEGGPEHDHDGDQVRDPEVPVPDVREDRSRGHLGISVSA